MLENLQTWLHKSWTTDQVFLGLIFLSLMSPTAFESEKLCLQSNTYPRYVFEVLELHNGPSSWGRSGVESRQNGTVVFLFTIKIFNF